MNEIGRCEHGVLFRKDAQGEWILKLPWYQQCHACNFLGWFDNAKRRATCFIRTHQMHTEYRCEGDFYGESWCQRCGEYEPNHWLSDNGDFRSDVVILLRAPWDEKHYAIQSIWRRWAYYTKRFLRIA
jgi:hypothetical protein